MDDNNIAKRRINVTANHLIPFENVEENGITVDNCSSKITTHKVNVQKLQEFLDRDHLEYREKIKKFFSKDRFFQNDAEVLAQHNLSQHRQATMDKIRKVHQQNPKLVTVNDVINDPYKYFAFFESMATNAIDFGMKFSLSYHFFGGAMINMGTEVHQKYLAGVDSGEIQGCFAMTELGHGSNVKEIQTTSTFDRQTDEFIINTPSDTAQKYWIGGSADHGTHAVVFAQLIIGDKKLGVHPFIVQLRENGKVRPGITIKDCGLKEGLNGVDNGRIWFSNVRIPRENLLNRHASVSREGEYTTPHKRESDRFAATIGELIVARMMIGVPSVSILKLGLSVAIKYSSHRRQFGMPNEPEMLVLDYLTQQRRLFPPLATCYALNLFCNYCKDRFAKRTPADIKEVHILVAALKISTSWEATQGLQVCRECCGGQGYSARNLLGGLRADVDSFVTIDGDNTVLLQQIAKYLLDGLRKQLSTTGSMITYFGKQLTSSLFDKNFISSNNTDKRYLNSPEFQLRALRYREERLVYTLANRFKQQLQSKKQTPLDAWNKVLDHACELGMAYIQRTLLEIFVSSAATCQDQGNKYVLDLLRSLYGLTVIESDPWFVVSDHITPTKIKAVRKEINGLCGMIRPHAVSLVDAFGIPEQVYEKTIASQDWIALNKQ